MTPDPPKPLSPIKLNPKTEKSPLKIKTEINETPTTTTVVNLKAEKSHLIKHERPEIRPAARLLTTAASIITATPVSIAAPSSGLIRNNSLLTSSPFNTVSPPNKTVTDVYEAMFEDENQFDEALILAAAAASEEEINSLVTPLLS